MIYGSDKFPTLHAGHETIKFFTHRFLSEFHAHFIEVTEKRHVRLFVEIQRYIDACLTLEQEQAICADRSVPVHSKGNIPVRIDKDRDAVFMDNRNDLAVKRREKLDKQLFGDHRTVIVAHVFRRSKKF